MDYTVQTVQKLGEGNDYGTPYNVKFAEEAETVFMLAKKAPVVGEVEHGNITDEPTKKNPSKTYRRFKRAKEGFTVSGGGQSSQPKQIDHDSMYRCNALNNAAEIGGEMQEVLRNADTFYEWLQGGKVNIPTIETVPPTNDGYEAAKQTAESLKVEEKPEDKPDETFEGEEINLDDIPF